MKKYLLILIILLSQTQFYAAEMNEIEFSFVDEDPQNIRIDERYPTLYKFLGENINEFNKGSLEQKYDILLKLIIEIKHNASRCLNEKKTYTLAEIYNIIDELDRLIEVFAILLPEDKVRNLEKSMEGLKKIASNYI